MAGIGGGGSFGFSKSSSRSSSFVDPAQQPFLDFLRNSAQYFTQRSVSNTDQFARNSGLYQQGASQLLPQLTNNRFLDQLYGMAGGDPSLVNQQISSLRSNAQQAFRQDVLPQISRQAVGVGALGGGRDSVAKGVAGGMMGNALSTGITDILTANADRSFGAAAAGGGLLSQGAMGGLGALPGLFDLGINQYLGGFAPLMAMNQIVGQPTILDKSHSSSKSVNTSGNFGMGI